MKVRIALAVLILGGVAVYFSGTTGMSDGQQELPETVETTDSTFVGNERANPYAR